MTDGIHDQLALIELWEFRYSNEMSVWNKEGMFFDLSVHKFCSYVYRVEKFILIS